MTKRAIAKPWTWGDRFGFVQDVKTDDTTCIMHCAGQARRIEKAGAPLPEMLIEIEATAVA